MQIYFTGSFQFVPISNNSTITIIEFSGKLDNSKYYPIALTFTANYYILLRFAYRRITMFKD